MTAIPSAAPGHDAVPSVVSPQRQRAGSLLIRVSTILLGLLILWQALFATGVVSFGFANWQPILLAYILWSIALCWGLILRDGEYGWRALFVLPAILFTVALVIFPTFFGFFIAFSDWNLQSAGGRQFNGLANFYQLLADSYFWNALGNMVFYVATVLVQYAIAFGLALLLNADIKAQKFFRVAFLLPFMLSPVAVSWMIGKSMLEYRFGPVTNLLRQLGWENPSLLTSPWLAKITIALMDAWVWIPFMMIMILAGLQALSKEVQEAAKVDGATGWQGFWQITFPLMLPVSMTTIILRIIFQLKLADIVINTTAGGPGGATDTISSFIFREYKDRSNVGYGTMVAEVYLILIIIFVALLLVFTSKHMQRAT
ncbi:carbohydrate ABC transporter permease [Aestuariivirga sp.]|uniref:carbohydrate ABC transporter permease n=1 Tax=Aestuariivirga sp. TaxID=2650926 RepID=UPI00359441B9